MPIIIASDVTEDLEFDGGDDDVTVLGGVTVTGYMNFLDGDNDVLTNDGDIYYAGAYDLNSAVISSATESFTVYNSGSIISDLTVDFGAPVQWGAGLSNFGGDLVLVNSTTGYIAGGRFGVEIGTDVDEFGIQSTSANASITNYGEILGGDDGIRMHGGTVDNYGLIHSDASFDLSVIGSSFAAYDGISSFAIATTAEADIAAGLTTINNHEGGVLDGVRAGAMLSGGGHVVNDGLFTGGEAGIGVQGIQPDGSDILSPFSLVNNGTIEGRGDGSGDGLNLVDTVGVGLFNLIGDATIENNGLITSADDGIFALSAINLLNGKDGVIEADTDGDGEGYAILLSSLEDEVSSVDDTVVNYGLIDGDVSLGLGDDMFVFGRGGEVTGSVSGGAGADVFVFEKKSEGGTISDFEDGVDLIDLSAFSKGQLKHMDVTQDGADTHIMVGKTLIVLENFDADNIGVDDFFFG